MYSQSIRNPENLCRTSDKFIDQQQPQASMKLNLGCGSKLVKGYINCDLFAPNADKKVNLDKFPYPFDDSVATHILMDNSLEHLEDPIAVLKELYRIAKPDATIKLILPYGVRGLCNPTHKTFWNQYSLDFLKKQDKRQYYTDLNFTFLKQYTVPMKYAFWIPSFLRDPFETFTNFLLNREIVYVLKVNK